MTKVTVTFPYKALSCIKDGGDVYLSQKDILNYLADCASTFEEAGTNPEIVVVLKELRVLFGGPSEAVN